MRIDSGGNLSDLVNTNDDIRLTWILIPRSKRRQAHLAFQEIEIRLTYFIQVN